MNTVNDKDSTTCFCAICGKVFSRLDAPAMPFCSVRCKNIDLGNWVDEKYGIPYEGEREQTLDPDDADENE